MAANSSGSGLLDSILNTGSGLFTAIKQSDVAADQAKSAQATAMAAATKNKTTTKLLLIGGGILAVIVVLVLVFRGR